MDVWVLLSLKDKSFLPRRNIGKVYVSLIGVQSVVGAVDGKQIERNLGG